MCRKIPIVMKHKRRVTCVAWSHQMTVASVGEDCSIQISTVDGDTVKQLAARAEPTAIAWSDMKLDERPAVAGTDSTLSALLSQRSLLLINIDSADAPLELKFDDKYGNIVAYRCAHINHIPHSTSRAEHIALSFDSG